MLDFGGDSPKLHVFNLQNVDINRTAADALNTVPEHF